MLMKHQVKSVMSNRQDFDLSLHDFICLIRSLLFSGHLSSHNSLDLLGHIAKMRHFVSQKSVNIRCHSVTSLTCPQCPDDDYHWADLSVQSTVQVIRCFTHLTTLSSY